MQLQVDGVRRAIVALSSPSSPDDVNAANAFLMRYTASSSDAFAVCTTLLLGGDDDVVAQGAAYVLHAAVQSRSDGLSVSDRRQLIQVLLGVVRRRRASSSKQFIQKLSQSIGCLAVSGPLDDATSLLDSLMMSPDDVTIVASFLEAMPSSKKAHSQRQMLKHAVLARRDTFLNLLRHSPPHAAIECIARAQVSDCNLLSTLSALSNAQVLDLVISALPSSTTAVEILTDAIRNEGVSETLRAFASSRPTVDRIHLALKSAADDHVRHALVVLCSAMPAETTSGAWIDLVMGITRSMTVREADVCSDFWLELLTLSLDDIPAPFHAGTLASVLVVHMQLRDGDEWEEHRAAFRDGQAVDLCVSMYYALGDGADVFCCAMRFLL